MSFFNPDPLSPKKLKENQKVVRDVHGPRYRKIHNTNSGIDIANEADKAYKGKKANFKHESTGWRDKEREFKQVPSNKRAYRQVGVDDRRFKEIDDIYASKKNTPKDKVIAYGEGRHAKVLPGLLSAQTHHADDSKVGRGVTYNTKPVWFDNKTKRRKDWEKFATHHEIGHARYKGTGKQYRDGQLNYSTSRTSKRPILDITRQIDQASEEEGKADRYGLQHARGMGRKGDKGAYEINGTGYGNRDSYKRGRKSMDRDIVKSAFGVEHFSKSYNISKKGIEQTITYMEEQLSSGKLSAAESETVKGNLNMLRKKVKANSSKVPRNPAGGAGQSPPPPRSPGGSPPPRSPGGSPPPRSPGGSPPPRSSGGSPPPRSSGGPKASFFNESGNFKTFNDTWRERRSAPPPPRPPGGSKYSSGPVGGVPTPRSGAAKFVKPKSLKPLVGAGVIAGAGAAAYGAHKYKQRKDREAR